MRKKINYGLLIIFGLTFFIGNVSAKECYVCGSDALAIPKDFPMFTSRIITLVQILVPSILIISSMIRYFKVVMSDPLKSGTETNKSFIRSIIAAVIIFIMVSIVKFAFNIYDKANGSSNSTSCVSCFINGSCGSVTTCPSRQKAIDDMNKINEQTNQNLKQNSGSTTHESSSGRTHGGGGGSWGEGESDTNSSSSSSSQYTGPDSAMKNDPRYTKTS